MKQVGTVLGTSPVGAAYRLSENKTRLSHGQRARARAALPHNRRESFLATKEIETVDEALTHVRGVSPDLRVRVRGAMWERRRRPPSPSQRKRFMLAFNAARDRAHDLIWERCRAPRTACDVYDTICHRVGWHSEVSEIDRRALARRCRVAVAEVSRHTAALVKLGLLEVEQDGRGVRYIVLPVEDLGYPLWRGDEGGAMDAAGDAMARRDQGELIV